MTTGAMVALRAATAERHRRLEAALDLLADDLTLERWQATLHRLLGVVEPLEVALDRAPPPLDDWPERRRATLLRLDAGDPEHLDSPAVLPDVSTPDRAMGSLYVLEGSTLGGRVVAAHVAAVVGPGAGTRWFTAYGDRTAARWRAFRRSVAGRHGPDLADAAVDTFDLLLEWVP